VHAGDHPGKRLGDVVERVVIVVEDDHEPVAAEAGAGAAGAWAFDRLGCHESRLRAGGPSRGRRRRTYGFGIAMRRLSNTAAGPLLVSLRLPTPKAILRPLT